MEIIRFFSDFINPVVRWADQELTHYELFRQLIEKLPGDPHTLGFHYGYRHEEVAYKEIIHSIALLIGHLGCLECHGQYIHDSDSAYKQAWEKSIEHDIKEGVLLIIEELPKVGMELHKSPSSAPAGFIQEYEEIRKNIEAYDAPFAEYGRSLHYWEGAVDATILEKYLLYLKLIYLKKKLSLTE